ncbi:amino acid ABC transporter permease [Aurantimonas sp. A2-1-M11]|uniref:amino acid ABC transporter permease n=1 Tax=Aurantimonas sp. A2-1-M11 TaxID=3113712 RepID=UPI002F922B1A
MEFHVFFEAAWAAREPIFFGFLMTIAISSLAIVAGSVVGLGVGLGLAYGPAPIAWPLRGYTDFVRGTPVLVLILASYYILSTVGLRLSAFEAGVLALSVFCSSHIGEIVRGALLSIAKGQVEAGKAIGLTFSQTFVYVLVPQAIRQILPTWVNTAAEMVKASTLLSIIGVSDLLLTTQEIISRTFLSLPFYLFVGFLYFLINFGIERFGRYVERRTAIPT